MAASKKKDRRITTKESNAGPRGHSLFVNENQSELVCKLLMRVSQIRWNPPRPNPPQTALGVPVVVVVVG